MTRDVEVWVNILLSYISDCLFTKLAKERKTFLLLRAKFICGVKSYSFIERKGESYFKP